MSFASDFASCLSPLPAPAEAVNDLAELVHFLEKLETAWKASGGGEEMLLGALIASSAGAAVTEGIGEAAAIAAEVTVVAYITACATCAVCSGGSSIWTYITASTNSYITHALTLAANEAGVAPTDAIA